MAASAKTFRIGGMDALRLFRKAFSGKTKAVAGPASAATEERLSRPEIEALLGRELQRLERTKKLPGKPVTGVQEAASAQPLLLTRDPLKSATPSG